MKNKFIRGFVNLFLKNKYYTFDELFKRWPGNHILIYPKQDSKFYQDFEKRYAYKIDKTCGHVYWPEYGFRIPVKELYSKKDFVEFYKYLDNYKRKLTTEYSGIANDGVVFRFIQDHDNPKTMHLDLFANYR